MLYLKVNCALQDTKMNLNDFVVHILEGIGKYISQYIF